MHDAALENRTDIGEVAGEFPAADELDVLVFDVSGHHYGLPLSDVREVLPAVTSTPLPKAPAIVEGIINVRGQLIPVLDVRARFRLAPKPAEWTDHLIVAHAGTRVVALRVDRAKELVRLSTTSVERAKGVVPGAEYVAWVAKLPDDLVLIHDLETFLSQAESASLDEATPELCASGTSP